MEYNQLRLKKMEEKKIHVIEIDEKRLTDILGESGKIRLEDGSLVSHRLNGSLLDRAIYLPPSFDWILGEDESGLLCLVPLKKAKRNERQ